MAQPFHSAIAEGHTHNSRQLHRTEDKLERVLQEVEALRDEVGARR